MVPARPVPQQRRPHKYCTTIGAEFLLHRLGVAPCGPSSRSSLLRLGTRQTRATWVDYRRRDG
eukprot:5075169-Pyramimonas_sp.AAC.1